MLICKFSLQAFVFFFVILPGLSNLISRVCNKNQSGHSGNDQAYRPPISQPHKHEHRHRDGDDKNRVPFDILHPTLKTDEPADQSQAAPNQCVQGNRSPQTYRKSKGNQSIPGHQADNNPHNAVAESRAETRSVVKDRFDTTLYFLPNLLPSLTFFNLLNSLVFLALVQDLFGCFNNLLAAFFVFELVVHLS